MEPWWNPGGTQGRPGPPRSLSGLRPQSFQLLGKSTQKEALLANTFSVTFSALGNHNRGLTP